MSAILGIALLGAARAGAAGPEVSVLFSTGSEWKSFGVPSILDGGGFIFAAATRTPTGSVTGIYRVSSSGELRLKAATKQPAELAGPGVLFSGFKDPLFNGRGDIAFVANLSGPGVTSANNRGLFVFSTDSDSDTLVARKGTQAAGAPPGAVWKNFHSVAFARESNPGGAWTLAFTASLLTGPLGTEGPGGVTRFNDTGLWLAENLRTELALREGQTLIIDGAAKTLKAFYALKPLPGAVGHGYGASEKGVPVQLIFTDNTQALARVNFLAGTSGGVVIDILALPGDGLPDVEAAVLKFTVPVQNSTGATTAWISKLTGRVNAQAVVSSNANGDLARVARKGDALSTAPGSPVFGSFVSVIVNAADQFAVSAKVAGAGITSANDAVLARKLSDAGWEIVAREGAQPPETPAGSQWATFPSSALGDGTPTLAFVGRLRVPKAGLPNPAGITSANDTGLWAALPGEDPQLLLREGDTLGTKTIRSFVALSAVSGSPAQRRTFSPDGRALLVRVTATDGSQHLVHIALPSPAPEL